MSRAESTKKSGGCGIALRERRGVGNTKFTVQFPRGVHAARQKHAPCVEKSRKLRSNTTHRSAKTIQKNLLKIQDSFHDNPKLFWSYHKVIFHRSTQLPVISYNGNLAKTPAELFNSYFSSVFSTFEIQSSSRFNYISIGN